MASSQPTPKKARMSVTALYTGNMQGGLTGKTRLRSEVKSYSKYGKESEVFSFVLMDESGEIRVSVFGNKLLGFWDICADDNVVRITGGTVKAANQQYNTAANALEITLSVDGKGNIVASNETVNTRQGSFSFRAIGDLKDTELNSSVDILGAIASIDGPEEIVSKAGKRLLLAKVTLVDQTRASISCTFWNQSSTQVKNWQRGDILALRGAKVQEYEQALCLGCSTAQVIRMPDVDGAEELGRWFREDVTPDFSFCSVLSTGSTQSRSDAAASEEFQMTLPQSMLAHVEQFKSVRICVGNREFVFHATASQQRSAQRTSQWPSQGPSLMPSQGPSQSMSQSPHASMGNLTGPSDEEV